MSLLNEILTWATSELTQWQRDALRRLFQKQELAQEDYDDLYAMLKSSYGLPDPSNRQSAPLAQDHLPAQVANTIPMILRAIRDLKHVNRIANGQKLEFAPKGITIIYGGNGSGKSGYFRVMKRACRARDDSEMVHPDAFDANAARHIPEATFDIEIDGRINTLGWKHNVASPDELSTIAVFDSRCARAYLDAEQDVAYLPYGLDIVENLGQRVLPSLAKRLNEEIASINTDITPFADLQTDTAVGKMISSLKPSTNPQSITALATLTPDEKNRLVELDKALAENNPKAKAKSLRLSAQRIAGLVSRITTAVGLIDATTVERLKTCDTETEAALKAENIVAAKFRSGEQLLPGTGEQVWKNLFESARRFSTEFAYPDKIFPHTDQDAQCPLCQQQLGEDAAQRMQRFENFVKQDATKVAIRKRQQRENEEKKLSNELLGFGMDEAITEELTQIDSNHLKMTQNFEKKIEARRKWLLNALKAHCWDNVPQLEDDPRNGLKSLSTKIVAQAVDLEKVADEKQKKALESERAELRARENLSLRLKAVMDLLQRMQLKEKLTKCKDDLKTKAISDKAKEFASQVVTAALKKALDTEFRNLGVGHIKTKLNERVEYGKMKHKLLLDLPITKKLDEILSEGEQRAIAIGSFLAELHLAGHKGGIVFDDPVSSLDHHWRQNVARRLVEEAKSRQVIILTHDTTFLGELRDTIEQQDVDHLIHHLEWSNGFPGHVQEGLPWGHKSYKDRLDKHEKAQKELERNWHAYPNENDSNKVRHEYDLLRSTIERVIQDVVFNGVIQRYRDWIRIDKLDKAVGFAEDEYKEIVRLHNACCDVVNSHDHASAKNASVPSAAQLGKDIVDLKAVVETIKARRNKGVISTTIAVAS